MTRHVVKMELEEADHYTPEQKIAIRAAMPAHEKDAREKGIPILGSGAVYPVPKDEIEIKPFEIPDHWWHIGALDIGWDHPTAAVRMVEDRDTGTKYITHCYRKPKKTPLHHAEHLKKWPNGLVWAWPADALSKGRDGGTPLKRQYESHGLDMLQLHAQMEDKSTSVEAGIMQILEDMEVGNFRVFSTCLEWFEEFGLYHRKNGRIVEELDDLMDATRYAYVMLRFAVQVGRSKAAKALPKRKRL